MENGTVYPKAASFRGGILTNYLFARCHYADLCLEDGKAEQIPAIFGNVFDLKALYPRRNRFHISEYTAFAATLIKYHHAIGEIEQAETLLQSLKQLAPGGAVTQQLDAKLHPGFIQRYAQKLIAMLEN